jgi:hypothetical protein
MARSALRSSVAAPAPAPAPTPEPAPALAAAAPAPPVPAPVPPAPAAPEPDPFAAAFAEAVVADLAAAEPVRKKPAASAAPEPAVLHPVTPPAEPAAPAPEPAEPAAPAPESAPVAPEPPQPQVQPPQPQVQPPQPQVQTQYQEPPLFNAEEATMLQTFYSEWPDVARATETMIRGLMTQTARRMYADMAASLAPYLQIIDTLADRSQLSELQEQVSDYDTVAARLGAWTAKQPAYLRAAYERVIKSGTADEVVDLINRYKQDMQAVQPAQGSQPATAAPAAAASAPAPALNPALAAAAARLAPVSTKRTNVVAPPTDFDTAFDEFARAS